MSAYDEQLADWASGHSGTEAAVELLIETDYWLTRAEFVERALVIDSGNVSINWATASALAKDLQCSRGEQFVLLLACSLADPTFTVAMSEIATLDGRNLKRVSEALHTAKFGWPTDN